MDKGEGQEQGQEHLDGVMGEVVKSERERKELTKEERELKRRIKHLREQLERAEKFHSTKIPKKKIEEKNFRRVEYVIVKKDWRGTVMEPPILEKVCNNWGKKEKERRGKEDKKKNTENSLYK